MHNLGTIGPFIKKLVSEGYKSIASTTLCFFNPVKHKKVKDQWIVDDIGLIGLFMS